MAKGGLLSLERWMAKDGLLILKRWIAKCVAAL
jgi:hypothetical protein